MLRAGRIVAALKSLSALAIFAALFLPLATCHDSHGVTQKMFVSGSTASFDWNSLFFLWPIAFVLVESFVRKPRLVRVLVALEPLLVAVSVFELLLMLTAIGLFTLGSAEAALGSYAAEAGFLAFFACSCFQNVAALVTARSRAHAAVASP